MANESKHTIQLSHGGGGKEMDQLIKSLFFNAFSNPILLAEEDAAKLALHGDVAFTTDSFTVSPLFFAGGDIGKLAIAGTTNDLAMMGAKPEYLSCSFIIEEGFSIEQLTQIVHSMATELEKTGAKIVCGDTKVVPRGCADGLFINTTGVGHILKPNISAKNLSNDDVIIISRDIGRHGAAILMAREGLELESSLTSDCACLWPIVQKLIAANIPIHAMRDATRGGIAAVLNEWAKASKIGINIDEKSVPVDEAVKGLCELFGFEAHDLANEGTFVIALPREHADTAIDILKAMPNGEHASVIGHVVDNHPARVVLTTPWGSHRYLDLPQGELLPRIC